MNNVYDTKKNYIISNSDKNVNAILRGNRCAVFIHLYYVKGLDFFLNYIANIPYDMDVYISYSNEKVKQYIQDKIHRKINFIYKEENRGRDISALLVVFRRIVLKYDYICFVHDKMAKKSGDENTYQEWTYSLWENMLSTETYIENIIATFDQNEKLGVLVPPSIMSLKLNMAIDNIWYDNFRNTKMLSEQMQLNCNLDESKSPITQGTCFWAKKSALKKLFEWEWKYTDFPIEPMPNDGTISHAVERIFAYVAQDAGYETGSVMTVEYANKYIDNLVHYLKISMDIFQNEFGLSNMYAVKNWENDINRLREFMQQYDSIYVYGAGKMSAKYSYMFRKTAFVPKGYVVTHKGENERSIGGIAVNELEEIIIDGNTGFVIAVDLKHLIEIVEHLIALGVNKNQIFVLSSYLEELW